MEWTTMEAPASPSAPAPRRSSVQQSGRQHLTGASDADHRLGVADKYGRLTVGGASLVLGLCVSSLDINHDLAIALSSALRLVSGQRMYVDYSEPHGPLSGWILAFFMLITPSAGWALVVASGLLNLAASLLVWTLVLNSTRNAQTAFHAGIITSFWFIPVLGAYYHDHLSYFLALAGFGTFVLMRDNLWRAAATAALFMLAFHAKQTVAATGMLALAATCLIAQGRRALYDRSHYWIAFFLVIMLAVFYAGLFSVADIDRYWFHAVQTPREFARIDNTKNPLALIYTVVYPFRMHLNFFRLPNPRMLFFVPVIVLVYWSYFRLHRRLILESAGHSAAGYSTGTFVFIFLLLSSLWCSALLGRWSQEVTFGVWGALAIAWSTYRSVRVRHVLAGLCCLLALPQIYANHPLEHPSHAFLSTTALQPISVRYNPNQYNLDATAAVVEYLQDKPGRIAVIDEGAVLVPLALGRAPWGPSSYLCDGFCIPLDPGRRAAWQWEFVELLKRHGILYVIRVNDFTYAYARGRQKGRDVYGLDLPILRRFVEEYYIQVFQHGGYQVLKYNEAGTDGTVR